MASSSLAQQWWNALIAEGATETQAAGIMGSLQNESGFNPEYNNPKQGVGGIQWIGSYLGMAGFPTPTGNVSTDITNQVKFLKSTGGFTAASGSTPEAAGQAFAMNYERCEYCTAGGSQTVSRGTNATYWAGIASSSKWPAGDSLSSSGNPSASKASGSSGSSGGGLTSAETSALDDIPGIGPLVSTLLGGSSSGGVLSLPDSVAAIAAALGQIPEKLENGFKILAWLANPNSWLRIILGAAGIVFAAGGIAAMIGVF